jgi:hypothetical protein
MLPSNILSVYSENQAITELHSVGTVKEPLTLIGWYILLPFCFIGLVL